MSTPPFDRVGVVLPDLGRGSGWVSGGGVWCGRVKGGWWC